MKRMLRIGLRLSVVMLLLGLVLAVVGVFVVRSMWFHVKVRDRIITETERATGGDVDIGSFSFDWKTLTAEVKPFVLRGTEPAAARPFFRAESLQVTLKIISVFKRDIDIASVILDQPSFNILVDAQGKSNLPTPQRQRTTSRDPLELFLSLAVQRFELRNGVVAYNDRRMPLDLRGENLRTVLYYELVGKRYTGDFSASKMRLQPARFGELAFDVATSLAIEGRQITFDRASFRLGDSVLEAKGVLRDVRSPVGNFEITSDLKIAEIAVPFKLPLDRTGSARVNGNFRFGGGAPYEFAGAISGAGLATRIAGMRIENVRIDSPFRFTRERTTFNGLNARLLNGVFIGKAEIERFDAYSVEGNVDGISIQELNRMPGVRTVAWNGTASGPVKLRGSFEREAKDFTVQANLKIAPAEGPRPVEGFVDLGYDSAGGRLRLANSRLNTSASSIQFSGTLGETLRVTLDSRDLNDLLPAIAMFSTRGPTEFPIKLNGGAAHFEGTVVGPVRTAKVAGAASLSIFAVAGRSFDSLSARLEATPSTLGVENVALKQGPALLDGRLTLGLVDWEPQPSSPVSGSFTLRNARLESLLEQAGAKADVQGAVTASFDFRGTFETPLVDSKIAVDNLAAYGEQFRRVSGDVRYTGGSVEVVDGRVQIGAARVGFAGAYTHPPNDWRNGVLRFDVAATDVEAADIMRVQNYRRGLAGRVELIGKGEAEMADLRPRLRSLDAKAGLRGLTIDGEMIGNVVGEAQTRGDMLTSKIKLDLRGTAVTADAEWKLEGNFPGSGSVQIARLSFATLNDLRDIAGITAPLPLDGYLQGSVKFAGPFAQPDAMKGRIEINEIEVRPERQRLAGSRLPSDEFTLRNVEPVVMDIDGRGLLIRSARFTGKETSLQARGRFSFASKTPWDLRASGNVNLGILRSFNNDLLASGSAELDATMRGSFDQPQLNGTLTLKSASFYLEGFPNGLDQANGVIAFDRSRATIEELKAQTGGGALNVTGFVDFGSEVAYRLQAVARDVRVRYPEGVSTTMNAELNYTGTTNDSLLAGTVTVQRLGFNPKTDIGGLLAESARPVAAPSVTNPTLRGVQFDVRIETSPDVQFQTSLTRDIQAETDLRLRGTFARPILIGRVTITEGEIQFFGNKYTINRGDIGFFNPVKLEPVLDLDLETKVRGITVNIKFSGPIRKLNVSYRSDPPLQSQEIIALLAVGRAPASTPIGAGQAAQSSNFLQSGANTLLGSAIATPVSSRLQRFFGVSNLKIDPQLTGTDNTPQARLTLEQQISKDITLTYVTNLTRTNQQIVRIQWDMSRQWSVLAVREENGIFGVDFQYRKQFK